MADSYIRKFSPNKYHIIAAVFFLLALAMLVNGAHRAFRVMGRLDPTGLTFEGDVHENDSILISCQPALVRMKEAVQDSELVCGNINGYDVFVIKDGAKYRFAAVKTGTDEYDMFLDSQPVTAYYSYKYSDMFRDRIAEMGQYFEADTVISPDECSDLGLIVIDRDKELHSFLWFLPFLIVGLILLIIGGSPFFYFPENNNLNA